MRLTEQAGCAERLLGSSNGDWVIQPPISLSLEPATEYWRYHVTRPERGDYVTRILIAFALLVSLGVGGCFHHNQAAYAEPLPPMSHPPLK